MSQPYSSSGSTISSTASASSATSCAPPRLSPSSQLPSSVSSPSQSAPPARNAYNEQPHSQQQSKPISLECPQITIANTQASARPRPLPEQSLYVPTRATVARAYPPQSTGSSDRLPTSERQKVLFITDYIGQIAHIRHLEEATNTLIYKEEAFGASFKDEAIRPHDNFIDVSSQAPAKRKYMSFSRDLPLISLTWTPRLLLLSL